MVPSDRRSNTAGKLPGVSDLQPLSVIEPAGRAFMIVTRAILMNGFASQVHNDVQSFAMS